MLACYGLILVEVVRDLQAGYEFGQLGVTVLSRFYDREVESKTLEVFNAFVRHWKEHVKETLPPLMQGYQSGLRYGGFRICCLLRLCLLLLFLLHRQATVKSSLEKRIATHVDLLGQIKQETVRNYSLMLHQATLNLMGNPDQPWELIGEAYNEREMLPIHQQANDGSAIAFAQIHKLVLCYL